MNPTNIATIGGGAAAVPAVIQIGSLLGVAMTPEQAASWIFLAYAISHWLTGQISTLAPVWGAAIGSAYRAVRPVKNDTPAAASPAP